MGTLQSRLANQTGCNASYDATAVADYMDWGVPPVDVP